MFHLARAIVSKSLYVLTFPARLKACFSCFCRVINSVAALSLLAHVHFLTEFSKLFNLSIHNYLSLNLAV